MNAATGPIAVARAVHALLPQFDPRDAAIEGRLLAALDGRPTADGPLRVGVVRGGGRGLPRPWIAFAAPAGAVLISPVRGNGALAPLAGPKGAPDAIACVAAMAALEPLLAAVEQGLDLPLRPAGLVHGAREADDSLLFALAIAGPDGSPHHEALLAVARSAPPQTRALPRSGGGWQAVRLGWSFEHCPDRLTAAELPRLCDGALIPLGPGRLMGLLTLRGGSARCPARIDLPAQTAQLTGPWRRTMPDDAQPSPESRRADTSPDLDRPAGGPEAPPLAGIRVGVSLSIPVGELELGTLLGAVPGSIVPLPGFADPVAVSVMVGGTEVAGGSLIALGDGFGVLISAGH